MPAPWGLREGEYPVSQIVNAFLIHADGQMREVRRAIVYPLSSPFEGKLNASLLL